MRIAIVDDEQFERDTLQENINKFSAETGAAIEVVCFCSGDELLENYRFIYDIILFDIEMPGTNGMDVAKKIRQIDRKVTILFVTNMAQYAINGYEVEAVDYMLKPITYFDFSMKMKKAIRKVAQKIDNIISVDTVEGLRNFRVLDIIYVEVISHYLIYHTASGNYKARATMKAQEAVLISYNFFRAHKSYLVNLNYINEIRTKEIVVGATALPLGRAYKDSLLQEYMRFIKG